MSNTKIKIGLSFDIILVIFFSIIPMVMYLNYLFKGVFSIIPAFFLWLVYVSSQITSRNKLFNGIKLNQSVLILLLIFILVNFGHFIFSYDSGKAKDFLIVSIYYLLFCLVGIYYHSDKNKLLTIFFYITVILAIQAAISIPFLLSAENYVARMLSSGDLNSVESVDAMKNGLGTNGLYTSNVLFVIMGIGLLQYYNGIYRLILLISIVLLALSVVMSTFFASVLLLCVGLVIVFIVRLKKIMSFKKLFVIGFLIVGFIFFFNYYLADTNLIRPLESKIERFSDQGGDVTGRVDLTKVSLETFFENPFLGIGVPDWQSYHLIGEHMLWLDLFAYYGFIGSLPIFIFLYLGIHKRFLKPINVYYLASVIVLIISNFISPMLVVSNTFIMLILFINKYEIREEKKTIYSKN